jgi:hypothetical protein
VADSLISLVDNARPLSVDVLVRKETSVGEFLRREFVVATRSVLIALTGVALIASAAGCAPSSTSGATASSIPTPTASSPTPAAASASSGPPAADPQSACGGLGGTVGPDQSCHVHNATPSYTLDFRFPVDYPDQQALTDSLTQRRDGFVNWVAQRPSRSFPYEMDIVGNAYHSGTPASGTQSLVFDIGTDTGVHPVTTYQAFNYDLGKHAPISFDTLFKPGTNPLQILNPIVQRQLDKHGARVGLPMNDLGVDVYRNFAITDDAVIFFFNQDGLLPHEAGPLQVDVPRTDIASLLA